MIANNLKGTSRIIFCLLAFVSLLLAIKFYVFDIYLIRSDSMNNTLKDGDKVLMNKWDKSLFRDEIVIFKYTGITYVKRCVGLPNDVVWIKDNKVYVNNKNKQFPKTVIDGNKGRLVRNKLRPYPEAPNKVQSKNNFEIFISSYYGKMWSKDNFGPIIIPATTTSLLMDSENLLIYKELILSEGEYDEVSIKTLVNKKYKFKRNYYFMLGDNRDFSLDSRMFGPIPRNDIIGKTKLVLFSKTNFFHFDRMWKYFD